MVIEKYKYTGDEIILLNLANEVAKRIGEKPLFAVKPQTLSFMSIVVLTNQKILIKQLASGDYGVSERHNDVYAFVNSTKHYLNGSKR